MITRRSIWVAVLLGACVAANAGTMSFTGVDTLAGVVSISGSHYTGSVYAGLLDFNESSLGDIKSVCVDLDHTITSGQNWTDTIWNSASYGDNGIELAGNIVAADLAGVTTKDQAMGLQLAVWEARYDDPNNASPDFGGGSFQASGLSSDVLAAADTYWQDRFTAGNSTFIRNENGVDNHPGQDQMTYAPVPEPTSIGVLAVGLATLLRRKLRRH